MSNIKRIPRIIGPVLALVLAGSCNTLDIGNPNAPDSKRALSDPGTVQTIAVGAFQTWYLTTQGGFGADQYPALTLSVMARSFVAAWNNFNIRFYTGCTNANWDVYTTATNGTCSLEQEGTIYPRAEWQNNPASAQRTQIEAMWYGYYSALSSANDVVKAIRVNNLVITDSANTKMVETMGLLAQGLALSGIALNYDQGFVVDYNTDLSTLTFSPASAVRDAALAKLDEVIANATANQFSVPGDFFGSPTLSYDNNKIAQIANTMAARLLAYFPRNSTENAAVDWTRVAGYASKGISSASPTPFDLVFYEDGCLTWCDFLKVWSNDNTTMRVHSRVAHLLDPATQPDPWDIALETNPNSADKRLGNGTYRGVTTPGDTLGYEFTILSAYPDTTGKGGTDFIWTYAQEIQRKTRGAWHQSAIGQVRYDSLIGCGDDAGGVSSVGTVAPGKSPMILAAENDLLWAEALLRQPAPDVATAALLIDKTRVNRGGLPPSTGTLADVQYEQDVELIGSNNVAFFNQRRIDKLEPLTPHEMPVPAKELGVLQQGLYTCGGAANPDGSCQVHPAAVALLVTEAPRIWADIQRQAWENLHHYGVQGFRHQ